MNRKSPRYKDWKKRQEEKILRHRQKRKALKEGRNRTPKQTVDTNSKKRESLPNQDKSFVAPSIFSFQNNASETTTFFNGIIRYIRNRHNFGKMIFIDISSVTELTSDALMYLLAIINNLNHGYRKYHFSGNAPADPIVQKQFEESGFYRYVKKRGQNTLKENKDILQIESGDTCNNRIAKQISDFVCTQANVADRRKCSFLYDMSIELLSNTCKHAYSSAKKSFLLQRWYYFVKRYDRDTLSFVFLDTGEGIPATVQKKFAERIDLLNLRGDKSYVISTFDGDFRTATLQGYRGKGLPKLRSYCTEGKITDFRVITNKADIKILQTGYEAYDMPTSLCGTLYSWKIKLSSLKGEKP